MQPPEDRIAALFAKHGDAVHAYACSRAGATLAPDIVSETFVVAWRRRDTVPDPALPWLIATARRVAATYLRSQKRQQSLLLRLQTLADQQPELEPSGGLDPEVLRALEELSPRDREAVLLVTWWDLSNIEAARILGCTPGALGVRLYRSRQRLRERLEKRSFPPNRQDAQSADKQVTRIPRRLPDDV